MAEAHLKKLAPELEIISAGTEPETFIRKETVEVMAEAGYDLDGHYPKDVFDYASKSYDIVITLSENARKSLPKFSGRVGKRMHVEFVDPALARGSREKILSEYREVRDEIIKAFTHIYESLIKPKKTRQEH